MKILYIHGLDSSLSPEKQNILERYGKVEAPAIDYENNPMRIKWLFDTYKNAKIDIIIGSSMGGFAGYHLSKMLRIPALIFNPALFERSVEQAIPKTPESNGRVIYIVLGSKDNIVDPKSTLNFLGGILSQKQNYNIQIRHDLEHRIPVAVFEEEIVRFMIGMQL